MDQHAERGYAKTGFGQIHYYSAGSGAALLLVHQAGRSARMFADLIPLLARKRRVVAVDLPGFGASDPLPAHARIEDIAECMTEVADVLGLASFDIYGLHTGNKIAAALAVGRPEMVRNVILAGQSHSIIPDRERRNAAIAALAAGDMAVPEEGDVGAQAANWMAKVGKLNDALLDPALGKAGFSRAARSRAANLVLDKMTARGTAALYEANLAYDLARDMSRIEARTLLIEVVTDEEDRKLGRQADAVKALIAGCSVTTLVEPDGLSTLENRADDVATIVLDFITERTRPETA